jgi:glucose-1-phosphate thymidylyltransferase
MRGIVLAGGTGSRLWPITKGVSKQLLPVHDKPLIYYPISILFEAGIKDILVITTPDDLSSFQKLLGDGSQFGVAFEYITQDEPRGLAHAFIIAKDFIGSDNVTMILGDNIINGNNILTPELIKQHSSGAIIYAYEVSNPSEYGVIELNATGSPISIEEKPTTPKSNFAVPGLYYYDNRVVEIASSLKPSNRGELEITDINKFYMSEGTLQVKVLENSVTWFDAGTFESLHSASAYVSALEKRQGKKIACLEEISWKNNWISADQLAKIAKTYNGNSYGNYLQSLAK